MIYVIEPHSDDCYLSLGQHCENWIKAGERVKIITVYSETRKRGLDAQTYAETIGADWLGLGLFEQGKGIKGKPPDLDDNAFTDFFLALGGCITGLGWTKTRVILPLAVSHPEHFVVRKYFEKHVGKHVQYYLDAPYQITQKNSETVSRLLAGMKIVSYCKPSIRKWRHIPLFRDQSLFFHRNPPEKLRECFELIVER